MLARHETVIGVRCPPADAGEGILEDRGSRDCGKLAIMPA
jgi:hypothetical protein